MRLWKKKRSEEVKPLRDDYCVVCDIKHNKYTKEMAKVLVCEKCTEEIRDGTCYGDKKASETDTSCQ